MIAERPRRCRWWRQRSATDEIASFDEESELARCEPNDLAVIAPRRREAPALEPLLEDAEPGAVPHEHLAAFAALVDEEEEIAGHRIATEPLLTRPKRPS